MPPPFSRASEAQVDTPTNTSTYPGATNSSLTKLKRKFSERASGLSRAATSFKLSTPTIAVNMDSTTRASPDAPRRDLVNFFSTHQIPAAHQINNIPAPLATECPPAPRLQHATIASSSTNAASFNGSDNKTPLLRLMLNNPFAHRRGSYRLETEDRLKREELRGYPYWRPMRQPVCGKTGVGEAPIMVQRFDRTILDSHKPRKSIGGLKLKFTVDDSIIAETTAKKDRQRPLWDRHKWVPIANKTKNRGFAKKIQKGMAKCPLQMTVHEWEQLTYDEKKSFKKRRPYNTGYQQMSISERDQKMTGEVATLTVMASKETKEEATESSKEKIKGTAEASCK